MPRYSHSRWLLTALCLAVSSGCTSQSALSDNPVNPVSTSETTATASAATSVKPVQVSDIPLPRDSKIDEAESLVIGSDNRWLGRLVVRVRTNAAETYSYYFNGMPRLGWTRMTAVQGKVSNLTFSSGDRIASMQISGGLGGSTVTIFVSTREIEGG